MANCVYDLRSALALLAFSAFPELKHVMLVDEDVDIFDSNNVQRFLPDFE